MKKSFSEFTTDALLHVYDESALTTQAEANRLDLYTFLWATSSAVQAEVDGITVALKPHQIMVLTPNQRFRFVDGEDIVIYQFNREFYCIKDHDQEVSCIGLLFFGDKSTPIVTLSKAEQKKCLT